eukprot:5345099-Karenia_brevis.AAC.1
MATCCDLRAKKPCNALALFANSSHGPYLSQSRIDCSEHVSALDGRTNARPSSMNHSSQAPLCSAVSASSAALWDARI